VVAPRLAGEDVGVLARVHRPARQHLRHPDQVLLGEGLDAVEDAQRVQLQQLAAVVLVHPGGVVGVGDVVVQVHQHRRAVGTRCEQVGESAERIGPGHLPMVSDLEVAQPVPRDPDVEVVGPEADHELVELAAAETGPQQRGAADHPVLGACCALRVGVIRAGPRFVTFLLGS